MLSVKEKNSLEAKKKILYLKIQEHYISVLQKLRKKVAAGGKLRVGFCVIFGSVFPAKPLFEAMLKEDLFEPFIIVALDISRGVKHMEGTFSKTYSYLNGLYPGFVHKGYDSNTGTLIDISNKVDLLYFANPYDEMTAPVFQVRHFLNKSVLPFYINYGYLMSVYCGNVMALPEYSMFWKIFLETSLLHAQLQEKQIIKGMNTVVTGYCKMDALAKQVTRPSSRKKIIIAPHHTVDSSYLLLQQSMFLQYADFFLQLPARYPEIDFVMRPHPLLTQALRQPKIWGEDKTNAYFKKLTSFKNMEHDTASEYFDLFVNSDGMIHDCASFLVEYMFTGHPTLYMLRHKDVLAESFNTLGKKCLAHCYHCFSPAAIISFIEDVVIKGNDPYRVQRYEFVERELKVNYPNVSSVIIDILKHEFF